MKIFLSFSGVPSRTFAEVFHKLLPLMNSELEPFISEHDIDSGARWSHRIAEQLENTHFGICFLTQSNLAAPWILFEAGALAKNIDGGVCGLLLGDLKETQIQSSPLSQFQHRHVDEVDFCKLYDSIAKRTDHPLSEEKRMATAKQWWPRFEEEYCKIDYTRQAQEEPQRNDSERLLEEVLLRIRSVERAVLEDKTPVPPSTYRVPSFGFSAVAAPRLDENPPQPAATYPVHQMTFSRVDGRDVPAPRHDQVLHGALSTCQIHRRTLNGCSWEPDDDGDTVTITVRGEPIDPMTEALETLARKWGYHNVTVEYRDDEKVC